MRFNFCTADHRGGLDECLETEATITEKTFKVLLDSGLYEFYAFDHRICADRFILKDMEHNYGLPTWLHHYLEDSEDGDSK